MRKSCAPGEREKKHSLSQKNSHVVAPDDLEARQGDLLDAGLVGREERRVRVERDEDRASRRTRANVL